MKTFLSKRKKINNLFNEQEEARNYVVINFIPHRHLKNLFFC